MTKYTQCARTLIIMTSSALLLALVSLQANATEADRIDGAVQPNAIPDWYKMHQLFRQYSGELDDQLNRAERIAVFKVVREISWLEGAHFALGRPSLLHSVCPMIEGGSSAKDIALTIDELKRRNRAQVELTYSQFQDALGENGTSKVLTYIDTNVTPRLLYDNTSQRQSAMEDPAGYLSNLAASCQVAFQGELTITSEPQDSNTRITTKAIR